MSAANYLAHQLVDEEMTNHCWSMQLATALCGELLGAIHPGMHGLGGTSHSSMVSTRDGQAGGAAPELGFALSLPFHASSNQH